MAFLTRKVKIGNVEVGGGSKISVQSMCNTDTRDIKSTVTQIKLLESWGCEIIRVAVVDMQAAQAIGEIKKQIAIPLVADIHFDYKLALECIKQGIDKVRINPGNIGGKENVKAVVSACADKGIPIRIGVNAGSLKALKDVTGQPNWNCEKWADIMVEEAIEQVNMLESFNFRNILVSLKADDMQRTLSACRKFAKLTNVPQHIGVTEAGTFLPGTVKSSITLGLLLSAGIGDTIRVSLTESPALQVRAGYEILKALGLREYGPDIISCPTCGRCENDVALKVKELEERIFSNPELRQKATGLKIAMMGCAVNGPGEARDADFGIAGGKSEGVWIEKGKILHKIQQADWVNAVIEHIGRL